jgi:4'-phosphopantetheinyl transferase
MTMVAEPWLRPQMLVRGPGLRPRRLAHQPLLWVVRAPEPGRPLDASVLDTGERRRAAALRRPAERALYVTAHSALRRVLGAYTGLRAASVPLVRLRCPHCGGPHGRPAVAGPFGANVHFSLSHSDGLALIGLATTPIGVDVQAVPGLRVAVDTSRSLHPAEQRELERLPPSAFPGAFTRCWTRKEAYLKATGEGVSGAALRGLYVGTGERPAALPGRTSADVDVPVGWEAACVVLSDPATPPGRPPVPYASRGSRGRR